MRIGNIRHKTKMVLKPSISICIDYGIVLSSWTFSCWCSPRFEFLLVLGYWIASKQYLLNICYVLAILIRHLGFIMVYSQLIATGFTRLVALADHSKANICDFCSVPYGSLSGMEWLIVIEGSLLSSFHVLLTNKPKKWTKIVAYIFAYLAFSCKAVLARV